MNDNHRTPGARRVAALALVAAVGLAACGGSSGTTSPTTAPSGVVTTSAGAAGSTSDGPVLPVKDNPITNTATAKVLAIDSVLVENNVDGAGKAVDDHLEVTLSNSGSTDLSNVEVFYTFTDPTAGTAESYYTKLPSSFSVPAGGTRVVHFDNSGAADHFPVNQYSLYATSANALDVEVIVSADGAAVQTATVQKDAGGAETPD
jgi:hypothetical protein